MKNIGILGGTFNPIHNGHLILAETARDFFSLEEIWFIPSGCSYMKDPEENLPGRIRAQMVSLAIADNPAFRLSKIELEREGNSYTCDTLAELQAQHPDVRFFYIVGADTLYHIESWRNPEGIFSRAVIAAAVRGEASIEQLNGQAEFLRQKYRADIRLLPSRHVEISSTAVRENCRLHRSNRYLIPEPVRAFLNQHGYYR